MLDVADLTIGYGPVLAVDRLSMSIGAGEIVAVVGPNGAGKSSIVRTLGGLVTPREGRIAFDGRDLLGVPPHERVGLGLSIVPEGRGLFATMSVHENLIIAGDALADRRKVAPGIERCFALFPILSERRWQAAGTLSGGQQQMLALSMGLMAAPRLLVLDEPSLGLAPLVIGEIGRAMAGLRKEGVTVALFEQNAKLSCGVADRIYLLSSGVVQGHDTAAGLLANPTALKLLM